MGNVHIVGGPSSGKSCLFDALEHPNKISEIARMIIKGGQYGRSIDEIIRKGNFETFQERCVLLSCQYESFDGGDYLVDSGSVASWAYVQDLSKDVKERLNKVLSGHFKSFPPEKVFVLEPLPYKQDGTRHSDHRIQKTIHERLEVLCKGMGWDWEFVPSMSLELRKKVVTHGMNKS